jgi:hypothetical protein
MARPTDSLLVLIADDVEDTRELYREELERVVRRGDPS